MSVSASELLLLHHEDLVRLLSFDDELNVGGGGGGGVKDEGSHDPVSKQTKHVILVVSVFLSAVAFLVCVVTLMVWAIARRNNNKKNDSRKGSRSNTITTAEIACDEKTLSDIVKSSPSLPQIFDKPKFPVDANSKPNPSEDELRKLRVESIDLSASFYTNRHQLQVNVRRVNLASFTDDSRDSVFSDNLRENAFTYLVVSLEPPVQTDPSYFESELRPVAAENYFEEASEFEVTVSDIPSLILKVAVYASDRFSQHRLVNAYTYSMECVESSESPPNYPILPVSLKETSRTDDNKPSEEPAKMGEILFSLCYMPTSGRLTFVALKGRSISDLDSPGTYLRVSLMVGGKTMKTVQTTSVQKALNPVYNEAFVFHTPLERIKDTDIVVSVLSSDDITSPQPKMLGKVIVGPVSGTNLGRKHWEAMLSTPRRPVAQWHSVSEFF